MPTFGYETGIAAADLDRDGDVDVVFAGSVGLELFFGDGAGGFAPGATLAGDPEHVVVVDVDLDGDEDVLSVEGDPSVVTAFTNQGGGSFAPGVVVGAASDYIREAKGVDLDDDGDVDLLAAVVDNGSYVDTRAAWFENLGAGVFAAEERLWDGPSNSVDAADLDGDGILDLVGQNADIQWRRGIGGAAFDAVQVIDADGTSGEVLGVDLDADGLAEVFASRPDALWRYASSAGVFGPAVLVSNAVDNLQALQPADLDQDGLIDMIQSSGDTVSWFHNVGGGQLADGSELAPVERAAAAVVADVDGDGWLDVIVGGGQAFTWLRDPFGDAPCTCGEVTWEMDDLYGAADAIVLDVDEDGDLDIATAEGALEVHENLGGGVFEAPRLWQLNPPATITFGTQIERADLDGDGREDVIWADDDMYWAQGLGGGAWGPKTLLLSVGQDITRMSARDVDGDGDVDVVCESMYWGYYYFPFYSLSVSLARNDGGGVFSSRQNATWPDWTEADVDRDGDLDRLSLDPLGWEPQVAGFLFDPMIALGGSAVAANVADLDGDGVSDVITVGASPHELGWLRGLGGGAFAAPEPLAGDADFLAIHPGDFDGDGLVDLAFVGEGLSVLRNPMGDDSDGDHLVDLAECDLGTEPFAADTDGGGVIDGLEAIAGTDPLDLGDDPVVDTDGDGLLDVEEEHVHATDPLLSDTDGDGVSDGDEVAAGTDPTTADPGSTGDTGVTGATGETGATGDTGLPGSTAETAQPGHTGDPAPPGHTGAPAHTGDPGEPAHTGGPALPSDTDVQGDQDAKGCGCSTSGGAVGFAPLVGLVWARRRREW